MSQLTNFELTQGWAGLKQPFFKKIQIFYLFLKTYILCVCMRVLLVQPSHNPGKLVYTLIKFKKLKSLKKAC